jgi:hypothetical protein
MPALGFVLPGRIGCLVMFVQELLAAMFTAEVVSLSFIIRT